MTSNVSLAAEAGCGRREERKHAETQIARVERRKLCKIALYAAIPRENTFAEKTAVKMLAEAEGGNGQPS